MRDASNDSAGMTLTSPVIGALVSSCKPELKPLPSLHLQSKFARSTCDFLIHIGKLLYFTTRVS